MSEPIVFPGKPPLSWKETAYTISPKIDTRAGLVAITGKACGIRSDDAPCFAVYDLPWIYPESFDWTALAKGRLDTFLDPDCACSTLTGTCAYHLVLMQTWETEDQMRNAIRIEDVPAALRGHLGPPDQDPTRSKIVKPQ